MGKELDRTIEITTLALPAPPTVLIVEDDPSVLLLLKGLLEAEGYEVLTAANGVQALSLLEQSTVSIVITDLNMPRMDGFELCRRIRARVGSGYVYVMLLTIRDEESDILAGLEAGADDYLSKRTSAAHLAARIRTARRILCLEYSLKVALEQKRQMAMTDSLTGVYNRRYFMRHLSRELKRMQRFGGEVSLILIDIDYFKKVNDTFGHAMGDVVLKNLTRQIAQSFQRETDWCARLGGEEFVVVLQGTSLENARQGAEVLLKRVADTPIQTSAGPVSITVSMGMSGIDDVAGLHATTVDALLELADANLYASKAAGRNCVTGPT
jgi:diguanylate cyclase (GGDEF)-like protein